MEIDPEELDLDKKSLYQKSEGENIKSDIETNKNDCNKQKDNLNISLNRSEINNGIPDNPNQTHELKENVFNSEKLMGVFGLLSLSWNMFIERWKKLLVFFLILVFAIVLFNVISNIIFYILLTITNNTVLVILTSILISVIFYIPIFSVCISVIELFNDKNADIVDSIKKSTNKIKPFFFTTFLGSLVVAGVLAAFFIIPGIIFFMVSYAGPQFIDNEVSQALFNVTNWVLGLMVMITMLSIYPIALSVIAFASFTVVLDDVSPMEAVSFGYELIKNKIFLTLWKIVSAFIIIVLCFATLFFLGSFIASLSSILSMFIFLFTAILYCITIPITYLFIYNIYENLRVIKVEKIDKNSLRKNNTKIKVLAIFGVLFIFMYFIGISFLVI